MDILEIVWNFEPRVIPAWKLPAWYGLMWALGFIVGFRIMERMLRREQQPKDLMDKVLIYTLLGGILGARFGHVFFYDWAEYKDNPIDMLKIWEGGLASHGGAIGIIIASWFLARKIEGKHLTWLLDRLVVPTALAGFLIRLGNLFNHEIVGKPTGTDYGFKFLRHDIPDWQAIQATGTDNLHDAFGKIANEPQFAYLLEQIPNRHPAQLYEAICYLVIFGLMFFLYWRTTARDLKGFLLGTFFATIFGARLVIEYFKEVQGGTDDGSLFGGALNMGQILSIPLVLFGLFLVFRSIGKLKGERPAA
ncbi:MAG: prolipoprotein diacylglyceryl transferase [Crocinitomicaceae bacterium]